MAGDLLPKREFRPNRAKQADRSRRRLILAAKRSSNVRTYHRSPTTGLFSYLWHSANHGKVSLPKLNQKRTLSYAKA